MSYVAINVLTVPEGAGATLEQRFSGRAGSVEGSPGFERFELLRPVEGTDTYLVYTRWASKADFDAWTASREFAAGHARTNAEESPGGPPPAATGSTIWGFEVAQEADPVGRR